MNETQKVECMCVFVDSVGWLDSAVCLGWLVWLTTHRGVNDSTQCRMVVVGDGQTTRTELAPVEWHSRPRLDESAFQSKRNDTFE